MTIIISVVSSIIVSMIITVIGMITYLNLINMAYDKFKEEFAEKIKEASVGTLKEYLNSKK